jgi:hypothetical protein
MIFAFVFSRSFSKVSALAKRLAYLDQHDEQTWMDNKFFHANGGNLPHPNAHCQYVDSNGNAPSPNSVQNCAKLNAAPRNFEAFFQFNPTGSETRFHYMSSVNNNPSNREVKGVWQLPASGSGATAVPTEAASDASRVLVGLLELLCLGAVVLLV